MNYDVLMDERQKHLHEHFPSTHYLHKAENVQRVLLWLTFYRRNPSRFVEHYFISAYHSVSDGVFSKFLHCSCSFRSKVFPYCRIRLQRGDSTARGKDCCGICYKETGKANCIRKD